MTSSPTAPLRLALLGAGTFAKSAHFPIWSSLQSTGRVRVRLVWSRRAAPAGTLAARYGSDVVAAHAEDDESAAKQRGAKVEDGGEDSRVIASAREALQRYRDELDAVVLCVPIPDNASFTRVALSLGLHVLCEKPLAHTLSEAEALLRDAPPTAIHAIAENFRYESVYHVARAQIPSICGSIVALRLTAQMPMPSGSRYAFGWRLKLPDAGILTDGFVHNIAALRLLADADVKTVSAYCASNSSHFVGCDTATAHFTFENDIPASVFVTFAGAVFFWELAVVGIDGDIVIQRIAGKSGYRLLTKKKDKILSDEVMPFCGIEREFDAFVKSCQTGKLAIGLSAKTAFNDMATIHSMFKSSKERCPVTVPKPNLE